MKRIRKQNLDKFRTITEVHLMTKHKEDEISPLIDYGFSLRKTFKHLNKA